MLTCLITDSQDRVVDIASRRVNLSRGYGFSGRNIYLDVDAGPVCIGDRWTPADGLIPDTAGRCDRIKNTLRRSIIDLDTRLDAAQQRGYGALVAALQQEIIACTNELATLSSP